MTLEQLTSDLSSSSNSHDECWKWQWVSKLQAPYIEHVVNAPSVILGLVNFVLMSSDILLYWVNGTGRKASVKSIASFLGVAHLMSVSSKNVNKNKVIV